MWLKFRYPNSISDQEQVKKATGRNGVRSYLFWKKDGAICDVRNRDDIDFLLSPGSDRIAEYEVAYEKYGIYFDDKGSQIELIEPVSITAKTEEFSVTTNGVTATIASSVSMSPKMSVFDRMAKARAARKFNKEK